jgi:hypothetical protein
MLLLCRYTAVFLLVFLCGLPALFAQTTFYSRQTGAWSALASWSTISHSGAAAVSLPTAADIVFIGAAHTITLDQTTAVGTLNVTVGTLQYDNVAARELTVNGNLLIEAAGTLTVRQVGAGLANYLLLQGNVVCNGTWTMRPNLSSDNFRATVVFLTPTLQTITGTPLLVSLYRALLNKGSRAGVVDCAVSLSMGDNAASLENIDYSTAIFGVNGGTWRQSAGTLTFGTANQRIELAGALHIVGSGALLFGQSGAGATLTIDGGELLFNTSSTNNRIGLTTGNSLLYTGSVDRSSFIFQQGTVQVSGRFARNNAGNIVSYQQSGGTLILGAAGNTNIASRGVFEVVNAASDFSMSGGTILLRNANASVSGTRPADFFIGLGASAAISGGTIQFSDASSLANQRFDWNTPTSLVWRDIVIGSPSARLLPFDALQNLRVSGNFTANGAFDGTQTRAGAAVTSILTLQGSNAASQTLSGFGTITAQNLTMNRQGAGSGTALALLPITVRGTLDLQEAANASPQTLELGANADITLTNTALAAILDADETRSIRTSASSGRLIRSLSGTGDYLFPVGSSGSNLNTAFTYTPLTMRVSGAAGQFGVRVAAGLNTSQIGAHRQIPATASSYARRVWSCVSAGVSGTAQVVPSFTSTFADFAGSLAATRLARYRPDENVSGNLWLYTDTASTQAATEWSGDWALIEGLNRVFFSRASGFWTDANAWSFASHTGTAVPVGNFPSRLTDSVIIGGGVNGMGNHVITLTASATAGAVLVGTGIATTGTLEIRQEALQPEVWLDGRTFALGDRSTLRIGSALGIEAVPSQNGDIRATQERRFSQNARYEYIGTSAQVFGSALPTSVYALLVNKPANTTLTATRNCGIWQSLTLRSGVLDAQGFTLWNTTTANASATVFTLDAPAMLRIGGANGFADATSGTVRGFGVYALDERSTVEFYGANQAIEPIPTGSLYGNLSIRSIGTKTVWNPLIVRGDMRVDDNATFINNSRGAGLQIFGTFFNSNAISRNNGVVDIGR